MENVIDREQPEEQESTKPRLAWMNKLKKFKNAPLGMIAIGVFLIIYVSFGVAYFQKQNDVSDLESEISSQTAILNKIAPAKNIDELQSTLSETEATRNSYLQELDGLLGALPSLDEGIDVYDEILYLGLEAHQMTGDVIVTEIAQSPAVEHESGRMALPYTLSAFGDQWPILTFMQSIMTQEQRELIGLDLEAASLEQAGTITMDGHDSSSLTAAKNLLQKLASSPQPGVIDTNALPFVLDAETTIEMQMLVQTWDDTASGDEEMLPTAEEE